MSDQLQQTQSTAVQQQSPKQQLTIRQQLESPAFAEAVRKTLPKHLTPERFLRVATVAIMRTPKLAQCEQVSFFNALQQLSQFGLEPDGRRAHLIPFENRKRGVIECQLIIDWKGLAELAMRSGVISYLHADVVYSGDVFEYSAGKVKSHTPHFLRVDKEKPEKAGDIIAVYALAEFKDGTSKAEVMSISEVDSIRARSKAASSGPWVTDFNEMAKKTAFRRLSKWLPLSGDYRDAIDAGDDVLNVTNTATSAASMRDLLAAPQEQQPEVTEEAAP